jgi:hypothetical protein
MTNLSAARKAAWATRRAQYGDKGHNGSYSRSTREQALRERVEAAAAALSAKAIAPSTLTAERAYLVAINMIRDALAPLDNL